MALKRILGTFVVAGLTLGTMGTAGAAKAPPKSCVVALNKAETLIASINETLRYSADYFTALGENANANSGNTLLFIQTLTADTETYSDQITAATPGVQSNIASYKVARDKCRAGK